MKSKSILTKFLFVLTPIYLGLVLFGSFVASQLLIRDNTDQLAARVGGLAARVSIALDIHEAQSYSTLAKDLIAPLGVDQAVVCVEYRSNTTGKFITAHPPTLGCKGQNKAPFEVDVPVDDYDNYSLLVKFTDKEITDAVSKQLMIISGILTLAFLVTLISAGIGFRMIVSRRLLALHEAIRLAANNLQRLKVESNGVDELAQIINAYNSLMDQDAVRERQLTAANEILTKQSKQDPLTGLFNRRFFSSIVNDDDNSAGVYANSCGTIMLLDIDYFKNINDTHGHAAGDEVLIELSKRLKDCLPDDTPIVRWGGEELLVYLDNLEYPEVNTYAAMLLSVIGSTPVPTKNVSINVTTSMGVVRLPFTSANKPLSPEEAVNIADAALYKAKSSGRNQAISIAEQLVETDEIRNLIENDFESAIKQGHIHTETIMGPPVAMNPPVIAKAA